MSDEGERTCPLCAEEMDLTDQQLKPCKCGYDICVWCWHHIMDMAEKDNTEGRCPACRTPYNKEKIVGTASKCERLVTGMSVEKKMKSQKGKTKTSEGRKQLGSVRVIQHNLVYIVGLPLNLADEDLLQQKEYFGQYGKVLKVSISRTAAGAIQQFANSTCSVYITYSKEEEAVRSIQSAHGFVLEGSPLRACFGTTKYCHAWLRNAPCTNADCLYLHEFGPQEDSFTKDEIVSAYTRNKVQQINGATNDMQRRSGNLLPPPADDYSKNSTSSWAKPISKTTTNNTANSMKVSPPNSSSGRSVALPAAASWGTRGSNSQPIGSNVVSFNGPSKQQADASSTTTLSFSSAVVSPFHGNELVKKHNEENHTFQERSNPGHPVSVKMVVGPDHKTTLPETTLPNNKIISDNEIPTFSNSSKISQHYSNPALDKDLNVADMSSGSIDKNKRLLPSEAEQFAEPLVSNEAENNVSATKEQSDLVSDLQKKLAISEPEDLLSFIDQRLHDSEIVTHTNASARGNLDPPLVGQNLEKSNHSEGGRSQMGMCDLGESSIISNILSMDFDPWDESLTSPRNLAKFLGQSDKQLESHRGLTSMKPQNTNQSRFSFARQDECTDQGSNYALNSSDFGLAFENKNFYSPDFVSNSSNGNGFSSFSFEESDSFASNHSYMSENKVSVSRAQVSAPPGFSGPSRAPPPGFTSHDRIEQIFDNSSGNHMLDASSLLRKAPNSVNIDDLEFMDPAILAVGGRVPPSSGGLDMMRSNIPSHLNSFENDIRLQLLMQKSFSQQNPRFTTDIYPQQTDSYGVSSRFQNNISSYHQHTNFQQPRSSMMSNGHWNGGNERMGFNGYYSGHDDIKFQLANSGNLYNRTFGI